MEYSKFLELDPLQIYLCAFEKYLRQNALQVPEGAIIATDICESEAGKYYFLLSKEQLKPHKGAYITARQVHEYNEAHETCDTCEYFAAARVYDAIGYEMHAAAAGIFGAEYAGEWLQKWNAGKEAAIYVFFAAATTGEHAQFNRAAIASELDIMQADPQPLAEYADIEQMQIEAARIAKQIGKQAVSPAPGRIDAGKLERIKLAVFNYYAYDKIDMLQFAAAVVAAAGISDFAACAEIYKVYTGGMIKTKRAEWKQKPRPVIVWAKFRDDIAAACGLILSPYKPHELEKKGA